MKIKYSLITWNEYTSNILNKYTCWKHIHFQVNIRDSRNEACTPNLTRIRKYILDLIPSLGIGLNHTVYADSTCATATRIAHTIVLCSPYWWRLRRWVILEIGAAPKIYAAVLPSTHEPICSSCFLVFFFLPLISLFMKFSSYFVSFSRLCIFFSFFSFAQPPRNSDLVFLPFAVTELWRLNLF